MEVEKESLLGKLIEIGPLPSFKRAYQLLARLNIIRTMLRPSKDFHYLKKSVQREKVCKGILS
jgi:hypothetical protein